MFVDDLHTIGNEAWLAGSITKDEIPGLWKTGVNVICGRGAACAATPIEFSVGMIIPFMVATLIEV